MKKFEAHIMTDAILWSGVKRAKGINKRSIIPRWGNRFRSLFVYEKIERGQVWEKVALPLIKSLIKGRWRLEVDIKYYTISIKAEKI